MTDGEPATQADHAAVCSKQHTSFFTEASSEAWGFPHVLCTKGQFRDSVRDTALLRVPEWYLGWIFILQYTY